MTQRLVDWRCPACGLGSGLCPCSSIKADDSIDYDPCTDGTGIDYDEEVAAAGQVCSGCGENTAMYCAQCNHKKAQQIKRLSAIISAMAEDLIIFNYQEFSRELTVDDVIKEAESRIRRENEASEDSSTDTPVPG